jgi:hypothetical protein
MIQIAARRQAMWWQIDYEIGRGIFVAPEFSHDPIEGCNLANCTTFYRLTASIPLRSYNEPPRRW